MLTIKRDEIILNVSHVDWQGKSYQINDDDNHRYVAYESQLQRVRNPASFKEYHLKHKEALLIMFEHTLFASFKGEHELQLMANCQANRAYSRPISLTDTGLGQFGGFVSLPWQLIVQLSIQWLQGLVIEAYGLDGITHIKEIREKVANRFTNTG